MTRTASPSLVNSTRPSPTVWVSRRLTRNAPPWVCTHGRIFRSHREVISCICGADLVVLARLRAAAVLRLVWGCCPLAVCSGAAGVLSTTESVMLALPHVEAVKARLASYWLL